MSQDLRPTTPTAQCELCKRFDASTNLDWVSKDFGGVTVVVFGHIPGYGCQSVAEKDAA